MPVSAKVFLNGIIARNKKATSTSHLFDPFMSPLQTSSEQVSRLRFDECLEYVRRSFLKSRILTEAASVAHVFVFMLGEIAIKRSSGSLESYSPRVQSFSNVQ